MRTIPLIILILVVTPGVLAQTGPSMRSDYVIFRALISPLYIENECVVIQVMVIPFHNNKPLAESCTINVTIEGLNVNYTYHGEYSVFSGRKQTLYLPPLTEGHYNIRMVAIWRNIRSRVTDQDFGVTKPPVPYYLSFSDDGSLIVFESLKLNESGLPDPNYPFRLEIYMYTHGSGESLVTVYTNVTNITIHVPASWKRGILYVEVIDVWGWRNSATINLAEMRFQGLPVSYDYEYTQREPFASRQPIFIAISLVLLIIGIVALTRWWDAGK